jgi:hypothetical protein
MQPKQASAKLSPNIWGRHCIHYPALPAHWPVLSSSIFYLLRIYYRIPIYNGVQVCNAREYTGGLPVTGKDRLRMFYAS